MYSIYSDGNLVYAPTLAKEGYAAISPKLTQELNKSGSLTFTLPPDNEMYDSISKLKSIITVMQDDEEIFRGRELNDEKDFYNRKKKYCEGELAFLYDSIQRPFSFTGDIPELFEQFINNHNTQVEEEKQFTIGQITVTDSNNYINRSNSGYSTTWEAINDKLIDTHGGYIRARLENGIRYIDLVEDYGNTSSQVIEFGVNLLDITEYINAEDIFTVLIPLGAESEDDDGNTSRLTIEEVNDGLDYIENETAVALFGRIWTTHEWDDVTLAENLLTKGQAYLDAGFESAVTLTISAVDLHLVDVDTEKIKLGDYVRVVSKPHNLDAYFLCSKIVLDLENPGNSEYTFGATFTSLTERQVSATKEIHNTISAAKTTWLQQAKNNATALITAATHGYVVTTANEILIMDTDDVDTATKVWRWNLNGLGYSSTGYNGEFGTAITMDGAIVADYITAGKLSANYIKLGGKMVVYSETDQSTIGGYFGYYTGAVPNTSGGESTTDGIGMQYSETAGNVIATEAGARINYSTYTECCCTRASAYMLGQDSSDNWCRFVISNEGSGPQMLYADGSTNYGVHLTAGAFEPNGGTVQLGSSTYPWSDVYASNSTIQTSDRNKKKAISYQLDSRYADMYSRLKPAAFQFVDGTSGRFHLGLIAQDVEKAMIETGLDSSDFAGLVKNGDSYFLRYSEFIGLNIYMIQRLQAKVDELERRLKNELDQ